LLQLVELLPLLETDLSTILSQIQTQINNLLLPLVLETLKYLCGAQVAVDSKVQVGATEETVELVDIQLELSLLQQKLILLL
jgi:hypothetical protein